jgi:DNA-binding NarL/FixJ family response regulator
MKAIDPAVLVLVVSMFDEAIYADRAIAAGAAGYLCKQATNQEIVEAVQSIRSHGMYLSRPMMERVLRRKGGSKAHVADSEEAQLSTRELQIFSLIGQGETTQKIAQQLNLAPSTVETYRERIKTKLNLANGAELTRRAILWMLRAT